MDDFCPMCGTENEPIGILGFRVHFRCHACGWFHSREVKPEEVSEEEIAE